MWRITLKDFQNISELYNYLCTIDSDIQEHLPILKSYGEKVKTITEFGVRTGRSTAAFLASKPNTLRSYDISGRKFNYKLYKRLSDKKTDFTFTEADTLKISIEKTDLLFLDTLHTYTQLKNELLLHSDKVQKYLIFHDTVTYGDIGMDNLKPGLLAAIDEFLLTNTNWKINKIFLNNNGLYILEKVL